MDEAPENFFSGAALAEQQDGNIDIGDERGLRADLAHLRAGCDEEDVVGKFFDLSAVSLFALAEAEVDDGIQFGLLKGFGEIVEGAELHGVYDFAGVVDARQHDDLYAGLNLAELLKSLQPVDAGHEHVKQDEIGLQSFFDSLQRLFASGGGFNFIVIDLEQRLDVAEHAGFVVDQ